MSEICSNCEIFNTGRSVELISANRTLFFNSFELCGGRIVPLNWPERAPSRIYIIRISFVSKFVFVPLAAQLG